MVNQIISTLKIWYWAGIIGVVIGIVLYAIVVSRYTLIISTLTTLKKWYWAGIIGVVIGVVLYAIVVRWYILKVSVFHVQPYIHAGDNVRLRLSTSGSSSNLSADRLPETAGFEPNRGVFSWSPKRVGIDSVVFSAHSSCWIFGKTSLTLTLSFQVDSLRGEGSSNSLSMILSESPVRVGERIAFQLTATDPAVPLSFINLPERSTFEPATGEFAWQPNIAGEFMPVFSANSGGNNYSLTVAYTVQPNSPPQIIRASFPNQDTIRVTQGNPITLEVEAVDANRDPLI